MNAKVKHAFIRMMYDIIDSVTEDERVCATIFDSMQMFMRETQDSCDEEFKRIFGDYPDDFVHQDG